LCVFFFFFFFFFFVEVVFLPFRHGPLETNFLLYSSGIEELWVGEILSWILNPKLNGCTYFKLPPAKLNKQIENCMELELEELERALREQPASLPALCASMRHPPWPASGPPAAAILIARLAGRRAAALVATGLAGDGGGHADCAPPDRPNCGGKEGRQATSTDDAPVVVDVVVDWSSPLATVQTWSRLWAETVFAGNGVWSDTPAQLRAAARYADALAEVSLHLREEDSEAERSEKKRKTDDNAGDCPSTLVMRTIGDAVAARLLLRGGNVRQRPMGVRPTSDEKTPEHGHQSTTPSTAGGDRGSSAAIDLALASARLCDALPRRTSLTHLRSLRIMARVAERLCEIQALGTRVLTRRATAALFAVMAPRGQVEAGGGDTGGKEDGCDEGGSADETDGEGKDAVWMRCIQVAFRAARESGDPRPACAGLCAWSSTTAGLGPRLAPPPCEALRWARGFDDDAALAEHLSEDDGLLFGALGAILALEVVDQPTQRDGNCLTYRDGTTRVTHTGLFEAFAQSVAADAAVLVDMILAGSLEVLSYLTRAGRRRDRSVPVPAATLGMIAGLAEMVQRYDRAEALPFRTAPLQRSLALWLEEARQ
jgi:hypothetical protein